MSDRMQKRYAIERRLVKIKNGKKPIMSIKKWNEVLAPR